MDKNQIINGYNKNEFSQFLTNDNNGQILEILDEEGLSLLEKNRYVEERINYILAYSKYKNELFKKPEFLKVFFDSDLTYFYASLNDLDDQTYDVMIEEYRKRGPEPEKFSRFFSYLKDDYKLKKIDDWSYGEDALYNLINVDRPMIAAKIIDKFNINLSDERLNLDGLLTKAKESAIKAMEVRNNYDKVIPELRIPVESIDINVAKKIYETHDIFGVRKIINDLQWNTNPEVINDYVKKQEEERINGYSDEVLSSQYKDIYDSFIKMKEALINDSEDFYNFKHDCMKKCRNVHINDFYALLEEKYDENNMEGVYNCLKSQDNRDVSNSIIDYHFEENYHNIIIDLKELLRFNSEGKISINEDHLGLYNLIVNIDDLSANKKRKLHESLKKIDVMGMFYDDMSFARNIVNEAIKEKSLNTNTIKQYRDEKLSNECGVDVYTIGDEPFFGIVKTGIHNNDDLPTGHSYSLVGNDCVAVYGNVENSNTFLYDAGELNPEQIVHVFPYDSFTFYRPFTSSSEGTDRVHTLLMPEEITGLSGNSYSELLIMEKGRKQTDMDERIPALKRIALYCVDEIREKDIDKAKSMGLGIILVKSKDYLDNQDFYKEKYKNLEDRYDYNYFDGIYRKEQFEEKRRQL